MAIFAFQRHKILGLRLLLREAVRRFIALLLVYALPISSVPMPPAIGDTSAARVEFPSRAIPSPHPELTLRRRAVPHVETGKEGLLTVKRVQRADADGIGVANSVVSANPKSHLVVSPSLPDKPAAPALTLIEPNLAAPSSASIPPNQPPVADAGPDRTVGCAGPNSANVRLDGSRSSDPDGDALTFEWKDAIGAVVGNSVVVPLTMKVGTYTFTLTVTDSNGAMSSDSVIFTVQAECDGTTVIVDENVTVDLNPSSPTCSDGTTSDLCQYFSYDKPAGLTADKWKAIFNTDGKKIDIKPGVTIRVTTVPASGDNRRSPGLEFHTTCEFLLEAGAVVSMGPVNMPGGDTLIEASGKVQVEGEVWNEASGTNGVPGKMTLASCCGDVVTGAQSKVGTIAKDLGGGGVNVVACCGGDVSINGFTYASHNRGTPPQINVASFRGKVTIDGNNSFGDVYIGGQWVRRTSGLLVRTFNETVAGSINIQAQGDINVVGNHILASNRVQYGAVAVKPYSANGQGGNGSIHAVSLEGGILALDRAFDFRNLYNGQNSIDLQAKQDVELNVTTSHDIWNPTSNAKPVLNAVASNGGVGGTNRVRSFSGRILIGQNAGVEAEIDGSSGQNGSNFLTACVGVTNNGILNPPDQDFTDDSGVCSPVAPTPIFQDCATDFGITFPAANQPPAADAGPDLTMNFPNSASLHGTYTDDGKPTGATPTFYWIQVGGPGLVSFGSPSQADTQATFPFAGTYQLRFIVDDSQFLGVDEVTVTVVGNLTPVVNAGPDLSLPVPPYTTALGGSVSDDGNPPGGTLTSLWSVVARPLGATVNFFGNEALPATTASFSTEGLYVLRLSASDTQLSASDDVTVVVGPNKVPVADAGAPQTVVLPVNTATLDGSATTDDGLPAGSGLTYQWEAALVPSGGQVNISNQFQAVTQATFSTAGVYILRLSASDSQFTGTSLTRVTVTLPANQPPVVEAGPDEVIVFPNAATLSGTITDDNPASVSVAWSLLSGPGTVTFANPAASSTTATFSQRGVYTLHLEATDGQFIIGDEVRVFVGQVDCTRSNKGTDFWLMFPNGGAASSTLPQQHQMLLFISGDSSTTGNVTVQGGSPQPFTVQPNQVTQISIQLSAEVTSNDQVESKGIHVTAQRDVAVYALNYAPTVTDGYMALPTVVLGTQYVNLSYQNTSLATQTDKRGTEFGIVATQDGTSVQIVPTTRAGTKPARVPYTVQLNQGQTYQLKNDTDTYQIATSTIGPPVDLTGTIIASDKPIAVFGAHTCTRVPDNFAACNHLVEQLPPVNVWGDFFVTMPFARQEKGDTFRFLASADNTHVQVNRTEVAILNAGEFYEQIIVGPAEIQSDQPILVGQYANSSGFSGRSDVDPFFVLVPPFQHFGGNYTVGTPASGFPDNLINLIAPMGVAQNLGVLLDGDPVPASAFQVIGTSGFAGAQISVGLGGASHTVRSSMPIGVTSYGWASAQGFDGYGYTGGVCLATGVVNSTISVTPASDTKQITQQESLSATVRDLAGNPLGGIGVTFKVTGVNPVASVVTTDASGQATFTYTGLNLGSDLVAVSADAATATASVTWNSNGPNLAPVVDAGPDQTVYMVQGSSSLTINLSALVNDDHLPSNTLTYQWTQESGPAQSVFGSPTQLTTSVTFSTTGSYIFKLTADDSALTGFDLVSISVQPLNQPPVVSAGSDQTTAFVRNVHQTAQLAGTATDESSLTIKWTLFSGPNPVTFQNDTLLSTIVTFAEPGSYVFRLSVSDDVFTVNSYSTVVAAEPTVYACQERPAVNVCPAVQGTVNASIYLNGTVTVNGLPYNNFVQVPVSWNSVPPLPPGTVTFTPANSPIAQATFNVAGTYVLQLVAGTSAYSDQITVYVLPVTPPASPTVLISSPSDGSEITTPVNVIGSVTSGTWTLEYSLVDDDTPQPFVNLTTDSAIKPAGSFLGKFDPTLLLNGTYIIRLRSTDAFGQSAIRAEIKVDVTRGMKVGIFTLSFNDLTVPMAGIPIQVIRTYDSRDKRLGDFGIGWRLTLTNVRLQKKRNLGLGWDQTVVFNGLLPSYCVDSVGADKLVTITFPDGKVYRFKAFVRNPSPSVPPNCQVGGPITAPILSFVQLADTASTLGATLEPLDGGEAIFDGPIPSTANLTGFDGLTYNPTVFKLTTREGFIYVIDQKLGVTSITGPNGNVLSFGPNGISHSADPSKSVTFSRDVQGRITRIKDPNNNFVLYSYSASGDLSTFTDRENNTTIFTYTGSHNLDQIFDPKGNKVLDNAYDQQGRLTSTQDGNNATVSYTHDLNMLFQVVIDDPNAPVTARREVVTNRLGDATEYFYDDHGNIVQVKDALLNLTKSLYDADDNLTKEVNALGKTSIYAYDSLGDRISETDPLGNLTKYEYNGPLHRLSKVTDPNGHQTTSTYFSNGNLESTTDPLGKITSYIYDSHGLLTKTTDPLGNINLFSYDLAGNLIKQTDALGNVTTYTYDANCNRSTQSVTRTTPAGPQPLVTSFQYDKQNRLVKSTYPDGTFTQIKYDSRGLQTETIDELGRRTQFTYDNLGRLTRTDFAVGTADAASESSSYDAEGRRTRFTNRILHSTDFTYDKLGRQTKTTWVATNTVLSQTSYDALGRVDTTTDARGNVTKYIYDDAGRRTQVTAAFNQTISQTTKFGYDAAGNQISITLVDPLDPLDKKTTDYAYDDANRLISVTLPADANNVRHTETTGYDELGRVTSRTDAVGKTTQYGYDALGRLVTVTDALGQVTSYRYDEVGSRIAQTDAEGRITRFEYDQRGRRTKRTLPSVTGQPDVSEIFAYDAAGNLTSRTDFNGKTTSYSYDNLNRLRQKTPDASFSGAASVVFEYNVDGTRKKMTDSTGFTTYSYDVRERLGSKTMNFNAALGNRTFSVGYTYDTASNLTQMQTGGFFITYTYDGLNRLKTVANSDIGASSTVYNYDAVGNLQDVTAPNGVKHTYAYDDRNRLTNLAVDKAGTPLANYAYALDASGRRTQVVEGNGRTVQYAYDSIYRLTQETIVGAVAQNGTISYTYDRVGNRLQLTSSVPAIPSGLFSYDARDRVTSGGESYDANGNVTASGGVAVTYDFENHLLTKNNVQVFYDGDGVRVAKKVGTQTTWYVTAERNPTGYAQVIHEQSTVSGSSFEPVREYVYGLDLIAQRRTIFLQPAEVRFFGYDGHSSVRFLTDSAGTVTDTYDYDAFGNLINRTGTTPNNYLYAGEQFDPDLNLYHNRARYLDVRSGRFWSMDEYDGIEDEPTSLHKYLYAAPEPVDHVDPSGRLPLSNATYGNIVHEVIEGDFLDYLRNSGQKGFVETEVESILGRSVPLGLGALIPDMVNLTTKEIYEIKAIASAAAGASKIQLYLYALNKFDNRKTRWSGGVSFQPRRIIRLSPVTIAVVSPPFLGLIIYEVVDVIELAYFSKLAVQAISAIQLDVGLRTTLAVQGIP